MNEAISVADNIDISIWGLILQADLVVRIVMLLLLMLSIFSWAIIFEKITKIKNLNKQANNFENTFWSGIKIEKIKDDIGINPTHPMETIFLAGIPALNARNNSPPETISAPAHCSANNDKMARFELALTAKCTLPFTGDTAF